MVLPLKRTLWLPCRLMPLPPRIDSWSAEVALPLSETVSLPPPKLGESTSLRVTLPSMTLAAAFSL
ncbi:hypothetical protein D9M71_769350 [compost metagenome]